MLSRVIAFFVALAAVSPIYAQEVFVNGLQKIPSNGTGGDVESAWLDLRQTPVANSKPQAAPDWVESVMIVPAEVQAGIPLSTIFRIRLGHPRSDFQVLFFRLFFDDNPEQKPHLVAWDESGSLVLQSAPLGLGVNLPTSESVMVPMVGVSTIDIEVPGDGKTIRGAYLDWMTSAEVLQPMKFQYTGWLRAQKLVPAASLKVGTNDLLVIGGPGTPASAIRGTQIQLKYLWDKSDYQLQADH